MADNSVTTVAPSVTVATGTVTVDISVTIVTTGNNSPVSGSTWRRSLRGCPNKAS